MSRRIITAALAFALLASCAKQEQWDQLVIAHKRVTGVQCGDKPSIGGIAGVNPDPREVYLGDWIVISVCNLNQLMADANAQNQPLTLFINGIDSFNEPSGIDRDYGRLTFILARNEKNRDLWQPLLFDPVFDRKTTIYASVGIRGDRPLPRANEQTNALIRLNKLYLHWTSYLWFALLVLVLCALIWLARRSDMLRDGPSTAGVKKPYSLARTQMAWWFFLVLAGYVFIWLVTGDQDTIPASLLGMLGISAATAIAAVAISPGDSLQKRRAIYDAELEAVDKAAEQLAIDLEAAAGPRLRAALEKHIAELDERRMQLVEERAMLAPVAASTSWWRDLVKDERGVIALDRLQVVIWSLVTGGIFLYSVLWELTMPEFSATLLALMGISSGTYIGFKLPGARD
jgi:hypothetical protein